MKRCLLILIIIFGVAVTARCSVTAGTIDSLMNVLEDVIAHRDEYIHKREKRIADLKARLKVASADSVQRYDLLGELFDNYIPYNTDSAYYYSLQREALARDMGDKNRVLTARLNQASALQAVGMYDEVSAIMENIPSGNVPDYLRGYYYHIWRTLRGNMADFSAFSPLRAQYNAQTRAYRDSIIRINPPGSLARMVSMADQHNAFGRYDKAKVVMEDFMSSNELSDHEKAICAWTLAESYRHLNKPDELKKYLIISSIGDMRAAVREYVSLRQLAVLLYQEGDLERAYRFMNIAIDDAIKSNARQRLVELSSSYPEITGIYVDKVKTQRKSLQLTLWVIILLALVLAGVLVYVWKQMKVISTSRRKLAEANKSLNTLNARLESSNADLSDANRKLSESNSALKDANTRLHETNETLTLTYARLEEAYRAAEEASRLKEAYIGKYMDQCVAQIGAIDTFRKSLLKLASNGKIDELKSRLKSTDMLDGRRRDFYDGFDETFLSLFPDFVEDFNALLLPEEAIIPKRKGKLNTELRIFALIRLGITDSEQIAGFLGYSVSTIYNYRTKVRNKARGDRSELEREVRSLSQRRNADK